MLIIDLLRQNPFPSRFRGLLQSGIHHSHSIAYHGVAINCTDEPLSWLRQIVPCGLQGRDVISLSSACGHPVSVQDTMEPMVDSLLDSLFGPERQRLLTQLKDFGVDGDAIGQAGRWSDTVHTVMQDVQSRCAVDAVPVERVGV